LKKKICFEFLISLDNYERHDRSENYKHLLRRNNEKEFEIPEDYEFFKIELIRFLERIKEEAQNNFKDTNILRDLFKLNRY